MRTKKILIIPHFPTEEVRVREKEIALHLSEYYDVHYLYWHEPKERNVIKRVVCLLSDILQPFFYRKKNGLWYVQIPCIHTPGKIAKIFNRISLFIASPLVLYIS